MRNKFSIKNNYQKMEMSEEWFRCKKIFYGAHAKCLDKLNVCNWNFRLETTDLLQSMDIGIIKILKVFYWGKLVNHIVRVIEENLMQWAARSTQVS